MAATVATLAGAEGPWLDEAPQTWNTPGSPVPSAPGDNPNVQRCQEREHAPSGPEEAQVAAAGWRLEEYWPTQRLDELVLVMATSGYDGMCRPWSFNAFAFVDGRFAGTLSPVNMNSRTDGAMRSIPVILPNIRVEATFTRYALQDPLCCPSRQPTQVTYRIEGYPDSPVLLPEEIRAVPLQLPSAGDPFLAPGAILALLGIISASLGLALRRNRPNPL